MITSEAAPDDDSEGLNGKFPALYQELRRLAAAISRSGPNSSLNPTALVSEAYVKLASCDEYRDTSTSHFKRIAANVMQQVLTDAARRRSAQRRGGERAVRVPLKEEMEQKSISLENVLLMDDLLERLRAQSARQAEVVVLRFYGGLTESEVACELGVSTATVERDWRFARAWLLNQLNAA